MFTYSDFPPLCCFTPLLCMMYCFQSFSTSCFKNPNTALKRKSVSALLTPDMHWTLASWLYLRNEYSIWAFYWNIYMFKHCVKISSCILCLHLLWNFLVLEVFLWSDTYACNDCMTVLGLYIVSNDISFFAHPWATFENKTIVSVVCFLEKC